MSAHDLALCGVPTPEPFETLLFDEIATAARGRAEAIDREWQEVAQDWSSEAEDHLVEAEVHSRRGVSFEALMGRTGLEPVSFRS